MESAFFTVADWVANPRSNSIRRKNRRSVLPPRLMDLLFYFAQHPMEVVSRQEIIDNCWDRDVVTDQAITQAIFELRKFLKDGRSAKEAPEYIKTVPKRGYRLLAPVHQLTVEEYIAATSENGAQGTQVIDDEDVAAERELQQPVSAAEPEHEAATSFESKILEETGTAALEQIPSRSASIKQERRGKVRYCNQRHRQQQHAACLEESLQICQLLPMLNHIRGKKQNHGNFRKFRRLKGKRTNPQPTLLPACLCPDKGQCK